MTTNLKPAVLENRPHVDSAGNRGQLVRVRYICGHESQWFSLNLGKGWKPRTNRQITNDELRITCPMAWVLCEACAAGAAKAR